MTEYVWKGTLKIDGLEECCAIADLLEDCLDEMEHYMAVYANEMRASTKAIKLSIRKIKE